MKHGDFFDNNLFVKCEICKEKIDNMPTDHVKYRINRFLKHIKDVHNLTIENYVEKKLGVKIPLCKCGCGAKVNISQKASRLRINYVLCSHNDLTNPEVIRQHECMKVERKGAGNPMYGKSAWNKGRTKETCDSMLSTSKKLTGRKPSAETRKKMSKKAKCRKFHGHTGCKHTQETIERIRKNTLEQLKNNMFNHIKTKPHLRMCSYLEELKIKYKEEVNIDFWSIDLFLVDFNVFIEVDGDYWHSNPKFYPNGPETKGQRINYLRDKKKNIYFKNKKFVLKRFWEDDILNDKQKVIRKLKKICLKK